jgi:hypothetical protein
MDKPRAQPSEIRNSRDMAELLKQQPVERADGAAPPEEDRLSPQIGKTNIGPTADPDRCEVLEPDILPTQKVSLRARNDSVSIDEHRAILSQAASLRRWRRADDQSPICEKIERGASLFPVTVSSSTRKLAIAGE